MKGDSNTNRFTDESNDRHRDREREQACCRQLIGILPPHKQAVSNKPKEQAGRKRRHRDIGLGLLEIVNERDQGNAVYRLVQAPPAQCSKPAHHAIGRGGGKRSKANPGYGPDDQIYAVRDLMDEFGGIVALVGKKRARCAAT